MGAKTVTDKLLVLCTCPDAASAGKIATAILEQRLAACVSQLPGIESWYRWQEEVRHDREVQLLIKTTAAAYPQLEQLIIQVHPYELPEILAVPVNMGSQGYLDWITESTAK